MKKSTRVKVTIDEQGEKRHINVDKIPFVIGRSNEVELRLPFEHISRKHMRISVENDSLWIEDLNSGNGTWIKGVALSPGKKVKVESGQVVVLGCQTVTNIQLELQVQMVEVATLISDEVPELKVANGPSISPASKSAPVKVKEKLKILDPMFQSRVASKRAEAEKSILEQMRNLMSLETQEILLVASEEAQEIRQKAQQEAMVTVAKASIEAQSQLAKVNEEAAQKIKQALLAIEREEAAATERITQADFLFQEKLLKLKATETEKEKSLERLKSTHDKFLDEIESLRVEEENLREKLSELNESISRDQAFFQYDKENLRVEKNKIALEAKKIEDGFRDLSLEERKVKAMIEVDLLEAKASVAKIQAQAEKAQNLKELLRPEVDALLTQKNQLSMQLHDIQLEIRGLEYNCEVKNKELLAATSHLEGIRNEQALVSRQIEDANREFLQHKSALDERERQIQYLHDQARKEKELILAEAREHSHKILSETKNTSEAAIQKADEELKRLQAEQENTRQGVIENKERAEKILANATQEASKIKKEAEQFFLDKNSEANSMLEALKVDIRNRQTASLNALADTEERKRFVENEILNFELKEQKHLADAKAKSEEILNAALKEAEAKKEQLKQEWDALSTERRMNHQDLVAKLESEYKENKRKLEASLAEYRHVEMAQIKKMVKKAEEELQNSRLEKAKAVSVNLYALIAGKMFEARDKVMDDNFIDPFALEMKEMIFDTMMDRVDRNSTKLQQLLKTSVDSKGKEKRFWKRVGIASASLIFLIILLVTFPSIITTPKNALVAAFSEDTGPNQADSYVQQKVEEARQRMIFNPDTTPEYKPSYVDNVLYTTDFESKRSAQAFQDKWILELNDYFIKRLDVKDTTIIKFVSLESSLLRDLAKLKSNVDPEKSEIKIEEMRAREKEFREKLGTIFEDPEKVSQYYEFSEKFWKDFYR